MNFLLSSMLQLLGFGALTAFFVNHGETPPVAVVLLFVLAEMGVPATLCSLILRRLHTARGTDALTAVIVGFVLSHFAILIALRVGPLANHGANLPAKSTLAWMDLTMRVGLLVLIGATAAALMRPLLRNLTVLKVRKRAAHARAAHLIGMPDQRA